MTMVVFTSNPLPRLALLVLLSSSLVASFPSSFPIQKRQSDTPLKYFAVGDSFAAGNGAGNAEGSFGDESWWCSRYDGAYGNQFNQLLNNPGGRTYAHKGCSTYRALQVQNNFPVDVDTDIATLTAGGNDAKFGDLVNDCVYRFKGAASGDCDAQIATFANNVADDSILWNPVWNAAWSILTQTKDNPAFRLYVTGYIRYWNEETDGCDDSSAVWNLWAGPGTKIVQTKDRRQKMNQLADAMNAKLQSVVDNLRQNDKRVIFVNYDSAFEGHRFCEDGNAEPQPSTDPVRDNVWIFQYNGKTGQFQGDDAWTGPDEGNWTAYTMQALQDDPTLQVNPVYGGLPDFAEKNPTQLAPIALAKVFHPTSNGHKAIAQAIKAAHDAEVAASYPQAGDLHYGPDPNYCIGVGPGGAQECINIPSGCYIVIPIDNTVPTPVCS